MNETVREALAITPASPARARTIDITTIGRRSGQPRRIETWFYRAGGKIYLTGLPGRRDWYGNLQANPAFTFHLKHGVRADLPATARVIVDEAERRPLLTEIVADLNQRGNPARGAQLIDVEGWILGSPLVEVTFDE
jgi:deazaflavin-dependent oxidoreductase (nitroreductase family)